MDILLAIIGVVLVFPYIAGPVMLWFNGSRIPPTVTELADASRPLTQRADAHFWKTAHFFASNGFAQLGERVCESARTGLSGYKQAWRHESTGEVALVGAFLKDDDADFCNTFVAFIHGRRNGAMVMTSNFDAGARTQLEDPNASRLAVPVQDLLTLRALHEAHVSFLDGQDVCPLRVRDGLTLCKLLDDATRTVALSRKRFRMEGDTLRITLRGAFVGIWINLPPLKQMYEREQRELLHRIMGADAAASGALAASDRAA
jgi:hypothetical protein